MLTQIVWVGTQFRFHGVLQIQQFMTHRAVPFLTLNNGHEREGKSGERWIPVADVGQFQDVALIEGQSRGGDVDSDGVLDLEMRGMKERVTFWHAIQ